MRRTLVMLIILLLSFILMADGQEQGTLPNAAVMEADDLLLADIPISYGEEGFRERILERTKGERDPIGLVLTGGSARAFAHIGVIKYLEEHDIEPDFIISNSMGSIIALLYAAGMSPEQIMDMITSGDLSTFFKLTVPIEGGLLDPAGFQGLVESVVGPDLDLDELEIPVMVICQDLVTKREVRFMEGPFTDIMLASFAIPAYFPPVEVNGHLLIDGGIVNLAPIDVAYDYSDTVIVSTTFYDNDALNLRNALNIVNTAFEIVKRQNAARDIRAYSDKMIWIRCAVEDFSFMDFGAARDLAQRGYESASMMATQLDQVYKHGMSPGLEAKREELQSGIDKAVQNQFYFARVEQPVASNTFSLGMYTSQTNEYPYYLRNTYDLGLEYRFASRSIEFSTLVGGAFDTTVNKDTTAGLLVSLSFAWYPVGNLRLTAYGAATFEGEPRWYTPSLYFRQGFDYKALSNDYFTLELNQAFEYYQDFHKRGEPGDEDQYMLTVQARGAVNLFSYASLNLNVGYMLNAQAFDMLPHHYLQAGADTRLHVIPSATSLFFDLGIFTRFSIDGSGDPAPIYPSDGFISNADIVNVLNSTDGKGDPYFFIVPLSIGYAFTSAPTFGELLRADYLELSLYCDLLFRNGAVPDVSTGVELQFELSLIGLQKIPMTFRFGYDTLADDFLFSLRFTVTK